MRFAFVWAMAIAALATLATPSPAQGQQVLERGNTAEPETLDPHKSSTVYEATIQRDLFEGLVAEAADGSLIPGVAKAWEVDEGGTVYTFQLRPEATWSNGDPLTAHDFVYAMQRLLNPATAAKYASILYPIQNAEAINQGELEDLDALGVMAVDDTTLRITLKAPTPYFLQQLTHNTAYPVHRPSVEAHGNAWTRPGNLVSNGAYILKAWQPQTQITLEKNPRFHDAENAAIDTVNYYPTEDLSTALRRFRAGELDINNEVPVAQIDWLRSNLPEAFKVAPYLGLYYYAFNTERPPFDDARVRRAIAMAIDREIIVEKITKAGEIPAYSLVPPGVADYQPTYVDFRAWDPERRRREAARLLAEAGFGVDEPLGFTLSYNTSENHKQVAIAIAAMLKPLGVQVELFNTEVRVHYNNLQAGDFQVARAGWIADYNDAQNFLFLLESNNPALNYANYQNPDYDALMAEAAVTADTALRTDLMARAEALALEDMPYIPIYYYVSKSLVQPHVKGWEDNVKNVHPTRFLRIER